MPTPTKALTIKARRRAWDELRTATGLLSDTMLADRLALTERTISRVLTGSVDPSPKFIAHTLVAFPFVGFRELFSVAEATITQSLA